MIGDIVKSPVLETKGKIRVSSIKTMLYWFYNYAFVLNVVLVGIVFLNSVTMKISK